MSLSGILSSRYQRRNFLLSSILIIILAFFIVLAIFYLSPITRGWDLLINVLVSVATSATFALMSTLYVFYFFKDPSEGATRAALLPQDIGEALRDMANKASDYRIYVRTGRHFRAEILPILVENARRNRQPLTIEAILLDFQNSEVCSAYADYRQISSFDSRLWDKTYVQKEVVATVMALSTSARENAALIRINLYLSSRLSVFRIEGSSHELIVTREDPKDTATRYLASDREYSAFATEFKWIRDTARRIGNGKEYSISVPMTELFDDNKTIASLRDKAAEALTSKSPYAR